MGYWSTDAEGHSFATHDPELVWGDSPADIMDDALAQIVKVFKQDVGREPSKAEVIAGVKFSLGGLDLLELPSK